MIFGNDTQPRLLDFGQVAHMGEKEGLSEHIGKVSYRDEKRIDLFPQT